MNRSKYREYVPRTCTCGVLSGGIQLERALPAKFRVLFVHWLPAGTFAHVVYDSCGKNFIVSRSKISFRFSHRLDKVYVSKLIYAD